ncbi:MAG: 4-hydroxy-tetrahydrodipicolinate reductase, partial [Bacteroidota bacterium]
MKIVLIGYGKMGKEIERLALGRGHQVVAKIDVDNQADLQSLSAADVD